VFLTTVFLAFVAFADGFFAAIERASAPCRQRGPGQVITHEGRDYTDGRTLVQPAVDAPFRVEKTIASHAHTRVTAQVVSHTLARKFSSRRRCRFRGSGSPTGRSGAA